MIRAWLCCLLASLCVPVIAAGQSSPAEPAATVRVNTNLVVVDVVVTDAHHNPVHNLTAADFTPLEDGHTQTIQTFEEHTAGETAKLPQLPPLPKLEPGVFTNYSPVPAADPLSIVLLDRLNTPFQDQPYSSDQLFESSTWCTPSDAMEFQGPIALNRPLVGAQDGSVRPRIAQRLLCEESMVHPRRLASPVTVSAESVARPWSA